MFISIESSSSDLSVALLGKERLIDRLTVPIKNELSEIIIPTIKNFLTQNGIAFEDISTLVVGCGPGSFTGIRVVVAAAKGIQISNVYMKVIGINSLAALAMSALEEAREKNCRYIISSIDTKRGDIFAQTFEVNNIVKSEFPFSAINEIEILEIQYLKNYLSTHKLITKNILFIGHNSELLKNKIINLKTSIQDNQNSNALSAVKLALHFIDKNIDFKNTGIIFNSLKPIYIRHPEIN
jgi:tRNA threonylcarbamoyl adenosine modification protein YeaZ